VSGFSIYTEWIFHFYLADFPFLLSGFFILQEQILSVLEIAFSIFTEWIFHFDSADFQFFRANFPFYRVDFLILQGGLFNFIERIFHFY
jgi:hypothetical protein